MNGNMITITEGGEVIAPAGQPLIIKGVQSNKSRLDRELKVNLKGFAPPKAQNDGNDLNFPVYPETLWKRYSENKAGKRFPVEITYNEQIIGTFWIRLDRNK